MDLKHSYKHINGMWPKTAHFSSEAQRLESWQTSLVIKRQIFDPAKRLARCELGIQKLN